MAGYTYSFYSELYFVLAVFSLVVTIWISRQSGAPLKYLVFTCATITWSALIGAIEIAALTPELKYFWAKISYLGGVFTPLGYFLFALAYCRVRNWLTPARIAVLAILPVLTLLASFTNEWHHLVWPGLFIDPATNIGVYQHGPLFWALLAYTYILMLIGLGLMLHASSRFPIRYRNQVVLTMACWMIPFAGSLMYLYGFNPIPGFDWSFIGYIIAGMALSITLSRTPLFSLVPLARNRVIEQMLDGIIVIDQNGLIADINPSTHQFFDLKRTLVGEPAEILENYGVSVNNPDLQWPEVQELHLVYPNERTIEISQTNIQGKESGKSGRLLILHDITLRKRAEHNLQDLNRRLEEVVEERTTQLKESVRHLEDENQARIKVEGELTALRDSLMDRVREQGQYLSTIYDIILSSGQSSNEQQLIASVLTNVLELFHCDASCIHQLNEETGMFHLFAETGLNDIQSCNLSTLYGDWLNENLTTYVCVNVLDDTTLPEPIRQSGFPTLMTAPIQLHNQITGVLTIFWTVEKTLPVDQIAMFTVITDQIRMMLENIKLRERIEQTAVRQERRRLARDLHDSVTQSLHSLVLASDTAVFRLSQGRIERLSESLNHIAESARQALKDMRLLLYELRLVKLEEIHLDEAIRTRLESVEQRAGIQVDFITDPDIDWPPGWQGESYAVVMEALNNSLKYARATALRVRIIKIERDIEIYIEDNGVGFDPDIRTGGIGLISMKERVDHLGGELEIRSNPGSGTRIRLILHPNKTLNRTIQ